MSYSDAIVPNNASSAIITKDGRGTIPVGLEIYPAELYFGALVVGEDQLVRSFTVTNIGRKTLRIRDVVLETVSDQFSMSGTFPELLRAGESFSMQAKYESDQPGLVTAVIYITTSEDRDPYRVVLSGRVISSLYLEEFAEEFRALLNEESWARATADSAEAGKRLELEASMGEDIRARIEVERIARVTAFEAQATIIETMDVKLNDNSAAILSERIVRATADDAMASRLDVLEAQSGGGVGENEVRAWISEESIARANAIQAEATARQQMGANIVTTLGDSFAADLETERQVRATADSANALLSTKLRTDLTAAEGTLVGHTASINTLRADTDINAGKITSTIQRIDSLEVGIVSNSADGLILDPEMSTGMSIWQGNSTMTVVDATSAGVPLAPPAARLTRFDVASASHSAYRKLRGGITSGGDVIRVTPGEVIDIAAWFFLEGTAAGGTSLRALHGPGTNPATNVVLGNVTLSNQWQLISVPFTVPAGAAYFRLAIRRIVSATEGVTWVAGLQAKKRDGGTIAANAAVTNEANLRATADTALAGTVATVSANLGTLDGKVNGQASAITTLDAKVTVLDGTVASTVTKVETLAVSSTSAGSNMVENSEFASGVAGWSLFYTTVGIPTMTKALVQYTLNSNGRGLQLFHATRESNQALYATSVSDMFEVTGNTRFQASCLLATHRAKSELIIAWHNSSGVEISVTVVATLNPGGLSGGTTLADYQRVGDFVTSPALARRARFCVRKYTGLPAGADPSSYLFMLRPMFARARPNQLELDPYSEGSGIGTTTASIVETATVAANSKGELDAMWRMQVTAGTTIAGIRLGANGTVSSVKIQSNVFQLVQPSGSGLVTPFIVGTVGAVSSIGLNGSMFLDGSMTIRGPGGDVLFHSGATLQNQIAPYQWGATWGATFGDNISGQIQPWTASTYIANGAIQMAQIGVAQIDYLRLAGGATSVSSFATIASSNPNNALIASLDIGIPASGFITYNGSCDVSPGSGIIGENARAFQSMEVVVYLYKNGTQIKSNRFYWYAQTMRWLGVPGSPQTVWQGATLAYSGGMYVSAVAGDVFSLRMFATAFLHNLENGLNGAYGVINSGSVLFTGGYR